jgi:hypothetical protein
MSINRQLPYLSRPRTGASFFFRSSMTLHPTVLRIKHERDWCPGTFSGTERDGAGRSGTERDGAGRSRTERDGAGRSGTERDGAGRNRTERDGTGPNGMSNRIIAVKMTGKRETGKKQAKVLKNGTREAIKLLFK